MREHPSYPGRRLGAMRTGLMSERAEAGRKPHLSRLHPSLTTLAPALPVARIDLEQHHCAIFSEAEGNLHQMDRINVALCHPANEGR